MVAAQCGRCRPRQRGASGARPGRARPHSTIRPAMPMERFIVEGGRRLEGTIKPGGNKNAALPILASCLLTDEPVILRNLPDIEDVRVMLKILEGIGVAVEHLGTNVVRLHAKGDISSNPETDLSRKIRASLLLAGPLLAGCGTADAAKPRGDGAGPPPAGAPLPALAAPA